MKNATATALLLATLLGACAGAQNPNSRQPASSPGQALQPIVWQEAFREYVEANEVPVSETCIVAAVTSPVTLHETEESLREACASESEGLLGCAWGKAGRPGGRLELLVNGTWATVLHEQMHLALFCEGVSSPAPGKAHHEHEWMAGLVGTERYRADITYTKFSGVYEPAALIEEGK